MNSNMEKGDEGRAVCPKCNGTGNAGMTCLAATDEYGCPRCGGCGYLDWRNDVARIVFVAAIPGFVWLVWWLT